MKFKTIKEINYENTKSILSQNWFTLSKKPVEDIAKTINELARGEDTLVVIGTDSQTYDKQHEFAISITIYTVGKGGRSFYTKFYTDVPRDLRKKLVDEAWLNVYTAWELEKHLPKDCALGWTIHADVNPDEREASSKYHDEVYWLIKGNCPNFEVVTKPLAWGSSYVSERIVKHKN